LQLALKQFINILKSAIHLTHISKLLIYLKKQLVKTLQRKNCCSAS